MRTKLFSFVVLIMVVCVFSSVLAQVPQMINYQGKLTKTGTCALDTTIAMTFKIYGSSGGTDSLWWETQNSVAVEDGIFNVLLGSINPIPDSVFNGDSTYLGIKVGGDSEMTPRKPIVSVGYAFHSSTADTAFNVVSAGIISVDGVSNPGGDVDLIQQDAITITPDDGANTITIGETHSARTDNPHQTTAAQTGALVSTDGVSNPGGDVDFIQQNSITIVPNDGANTVTFGETHSPRTDNPHSTTAAQTGALVSVDGVSNAGGNVDFIAGSNMTITPDDGANTITFSASGGDNDWTFRVTDTADTTLTTGGAWGIARYGNTLYGNADSTHVNLGVACTTGASGQNYKYCTVGGGNSNTASNEYATVGGGVSNTASGFEATVGGGFANVATGFRSTVGGGYNNTASDSSVTVSGGTNNEASGRYAVVSGGKDNSASGSYAMIGGGFDNTASGDSSTVGGGSHNMASADAATVGGGAVNVANAPRATVSGGAYNNATDFAAAVGGGTYNVAAVFGATVSGGMGNLSSDTGATVGGGSYNKARGKYSVVSGGGGGDAADSNSALGGWSTIGGGRNNTASGHDATVVGGDSNTASGTGATVGGGVYHTASGEFGAVGGGILNTASGDGATVGGGGSNTASVYLATVGGGNHNTADDTAATVGGGRNNNARGMYSVVAGGGGPNESDSNSVIGDWSTVSGGQQNIASGSWSIVGGGQNNEAGNLGTTVAGGVGNYASGNMATIGGGNNNTASGRWSTVAGGVENTADDTAATVGGGRSNTADSIGATVGGGYDNLASGSYSTVPGGYLNEATGNYSFAAGKQALAVTNNTFVWNDGSTGYFSSTGAEQFLIGAGGGVGIGTSNPGTSALKVTNDFTGSFSQMVYFQSVTDPSVNNDVLAVDVPSTALDGIQFIECARGSDNEFKVNGDGNVYADGAYNTPASDFAEMIRVSSGASTVEPGDVMVIDPNNSRSIIKTTSPRSTLVAGIYSTKPGFIGSERDWDKPTGEEEVGTYTLKDMAAEFNEIPLAVVGIVPCKVSTENGPIRPGDLLVTSSTPGHAMRDDNPKVGTVLGKALGSLSSGTDVIKVLVTLH